MSESLRPGRRRCQEMSEALRNVSVMKKLAAIGLVTATLVILFNVAPQALGWILVVGVLGVILATALYGVGLTVVHEPLVPISETSVLGRRVASFVKISLAAVALMFTTSFSWIIAERLSVRLSSGGRITDVLISLASELLLPISLFAYFWWMTLSVDLLRIKKAGRASTLVKLLQIVGSSALGTELGVSTSIDRPIGRALYRLGCFLMGDWWWILASFYLAPVVAIVAFECLART